MISIGLIMVSTVKNTQKNLSGELVEKIPTVREANGNLEFTLGDY